MFINTFETFGNRHRHQQRLSTLIVYIERNKKVTMLKA